MRLAELLKSHNFVVDVRGEPDAVGHALEVASVDHVRIRMSSDDQQTVEEAERRLELSGLKTTWQLVSALVDRIRNGTTVVLENMKEC